MMPIRYATATPVRSIPIRFKAEDFEPAWVTPESKAKETQTPTERPFPWMDKFFDWVSQTRFYQFLDQKVFPKTLYPGVEWIENTLENGSTLAARRAPRFLFFGKDRNTFCYPTPEEAKNNPELEKTGMLRSLQDFNRHLISNTFSMCFWFIFGTQALVEATKSLSDPDPLYSQQPVKLSKLDRFFLKHAFKIDPDTLPQLEETPPTQDSAI